MLMMCSDKGKSIWISVLLSGANLPPSLMVLEGFCFPLMSNGSSVSRKGKIGRRGLDGVLGLGRGLGFEGRIQGLVDSGETTLGVKVKHKKIKDANTKANSRKVLRFVMRFISCLDG